MKNKAVISIVVIAVLLGVVWFTAPARNKGPAKTEDVIWRMFAAARTGDIQQYLDCFSGSSLATLLDNRKQSKSDTAFRDYIRRDVQDIKGLSIINGRQENPQKIVFDVEVVYADRNEDQIFALQKVQDTWKIAEISRPVITRQPIRYMDTVVKE
ncbi:MAG: hypothetical protein AB1847_12830 [bacterium]